MADEQEGIPLMAPEEYVHDFHTGVAQVSARSFKDQDLIHAPKSRWSKSTILVFFACAVTALSLVSNFITFAITWHPLNTAGSTTKLDASKLRRPSLYLGLERVPAIKLRHGGDQHTPEPSASTPGSTRIGWPSAIARVNSVHSYLVFPQDGWVFLTEQDHAIMKFPGMPNVQPGQQCAFRAYFPARRDLEDKLLTIERDDGVAQSTDVRLVALSPPPTQLSHLTWSSRPAALTSSDRPITLTAAFGSNQTTETFACPTVSPLYVEAMCTGGGCRLEYDASAALVDVRPSLGIQIITV